MSSSIPFDRYDEEFLSLTTQIQSTLSKATADDESPSPPSATSSSTPEDNLQMAHNLLTQAKDLIQQMSIEARGITTKDLKQDCLQKVRVCKANLANLEEDAGRARTALERRSLLSPSSKKRSDGGAGLSSDHRERLLDATNALTSQNATLDNARRVMAETEDVALDITEELARNRETMESARGRVRNVSGLTNRARRVLVSMRRREVQQRMVVYGVGVVVAVVVIYMVTLL